MLQRFWQTLPPGTRHKLCIGSVGAQHLQETSAMAQAEGRPELATELLLAAWEQNPLDGVSAARILDSGAYEDTPLASVLRAVVRTWRPTASDSPFAELVRVMNYEQAFALAQEQVDTESDNIFWATQLVVLGMMLGRGVRAMERIVTLPALQDEQLAPLKQFLAAARHFVLEEWDAAERGYATLCEHPVSKVWLTPLEHRAEACLQLGRRDQAMELWREILRKRPWHCQLLLRAHGELEPLPEAGSLPATAVLLYTWNKAEFLDAALGAVAASRGVERVLALDNGSTDTTPEVLRAWRERLGHEAMELHTLPLNVGAPAARNWLAALPTLENMECVAYLDDDALPPPDWLEQLHAARQVYPDSTSWGCCVVDHNASQMVQSADLHLLLETVPGDTPRLAFDLKSAYANPFRLSELHAQVPQRGQFQYVRPCVSVTGCCHLLNMKELREGGGFDLRFAPSQYDDVERDLRRAIQGRFCCYQGLLTVRHVRRSGSAAPLSGPALGNWVANRYKLAHRFEEEALVQLHARQAERLFDDLQARLPELERLLGLSEA